MEFNRVEKKLVKSLVASITESAYVSGEISMEDFNDKNHLLKKLRDYIPKNDKDLFFTIIHDKNLIQRAEEEISKEDWQYAYVFYATYFEHFINEILCIWAVKQKKPHKLIKELIRRVGGIEDKYTWVLEILDLPKFNERHFKTIKYLSEKRNSFIHYKFEPKASSEDSNKEKEEWKKIKFDVSKAIIYSKSYRSRIVWNGKKNKVI